MAITVYEKLNSRKPSAGESPADTLDYFLYATSSDVDDDAANLAALKAAAPTTWRGLVRTSYALGENHGAGVWEGTASYKAADQTPKDVGEVSVSFDTSGGTAHIQLAQFSNFAYAPSGKTAPETGRLIGVTPDSVEGVDIVVPKFEFQETWTFADSSINPSFVDTLFRLTGTTNEDDFRHLGPTECLFLGAEGHRRPDKTDPTLLVWDLTFKFAGSPLETDKDIGNDINVDFVGGFDYLWIMYSKSDSGTPALTGQKVIAAYVSRVYPETDFSELGIGT